MKRNKAVFCQKPLTQTIYEARYLRKMAKQRKLVTLMGNQGSSADGLRRAGETIQDGLIGQVHEVHVWTNRPVWPQGMDRPLGEDPVPATLDWDIWIGPAPMRPYKASHIPVDRYGIYEPFTWRGWQDFGTGALGDMACHTVNMPFRALNLEYPTVVEAMPLGRIPSVPKFASTFPSAKRTFPSNIRIFSIMTERSSTMRWHCGGMTAASLTPQPAAAMT